MNLRVHFQIPPSRDELHTLRENLNRNIKLTTGIEIPDPADYQILVAGRPVRELLDASESLQILIIPWAGIPLSTQQLMLDYPNIQIHNLHYNASATAEFAFALLLAAAKRIVPIDQAFRRNDWRMRYGPNPSVVLEGRTALVLGYGEIGRRIGQMCLGFGMDVIGVRQTVDQVERDGEIEIFPKNKLHQVLPKANILIVSLPETPETREMIGRDELELLPEDAILVNVARGPIVAEGALYEVLSNGKLLAAGLDVWYQYPDSEADRENTPPSAYPFHELDNVVMSPHRAGDWEESGFERMRDLAVLLNDAAEGKPLENQVDLERGY